MTAWGRAGRGAAKGVFRPVILATGRRIRPPPKLHWPRGRGAVGFNLFLEKPVFRRVRIRARVFECVFAAVFDGAMALARRPRRLGICWPNVWLGLRLYRAGFFRGRASNGSRSRAVRTSDVRCLAASVLLLAGARPIIGAFGARLLYNPRTVRRPGPPESHSRLRRRYPDSLFVSVGLDHLRPSVRGRSEPAPLSWARRLLQASGETPRDGISARPRPVRRFLARSFYIGICDAHACSRRPFASAEAFP